MKRTRWSGLVLVVGGIAGLCAPVPAFAGDPAVTSVVEGRDAASGRPVVVLLGNDLTRAKSFALQNALDHADAGPVQVLVRTKNLLVLALPEALPQGGYEIVLTHKKGTAKASVLLTRGELLPGSVKPEALEGTLKGDLEDASTLDGRSPSYFTDASNLNTGALSPALFSAITDLTLEGRIGTASDQVARGDHEHDAAYLRRTELQDTGTVNASSNPVDWTKLKGVPADLADGDGNTIYAAGTGLALTGTTFSVPFEGTGAADTSARSDHEHDARYYTEAELSVGGSINTGTNPVDWTKLKSVPPGFADGTDADTTYLSGLGLVLSNNAFTVLWGGNGSANTSARSDHDHDARYFTQTQLAGAGTLNASSNPVDWTKLKNVPSGLADGVDADTTYSAGPGLALGGTTLSVDFVGTGSASSAARSDHDHDSRYAPVKHDHDDLYPTKDELAVGGGINEKANPVDWTKLKGVPSGFEDGVDADHAYQPGVGLNLTGEVFAVNFAGTGSASNVARSDHDHDARYYTEFELNAAGGAINALSNPVDWSRLKNVPPGFADGNDASTTYTSGSGLTLSNGQFAADFGATSTTVTRGNDSRLPPTPATPGALLYDNGTNYVRLSQGTNGHVLNTVSGAPSWQPNTWTVSGGDVYRSAGHVGIGVTAPAAALHVAGNDGALFTGAIGSGTIPATGNGVRMMWYPKKAAFRAGLAVSGHWDDANVGYTSFAAGEATRASGPYSAAFGAFSVASGEESFAAGYDTEASGLRSVALGASAKATGDASFAGGVANAFGDASTAFGDGATASGQAATAFGGSVTASGDYAVAGGLVATASGFAATTFGNRTIASGSTSTALGNFTVSQPFGSVALGQYNKVEGTTDSWQSGDPVLVVGNGSSTSNRTNCFTLLKNGNLTISGSLSQNSDARLKKDIAPLAGVLPKIRAIRGVTYRFKDADRNPGDAQVGLLAQEVRAQFPELVSEDADGKLSIAYGNFNAVLVEAIREQEDEIAAMKKELAAAKDGFEARLARIEASIATK